MQDRASALERQNASLEKQNALLIATSQETQKQYDELVRGLSWEVAKVQFQMRQYKHMLSVDLAEQIFFDSGSATLKAGGKEVL